MTFVVWKSHSKDNLAQSTEYMLSYTVQACMHTICACTHKSVIILSSFGKNKLDNKVDNSLVKDEKRILPDIWCVSGDVELCSRIKVRLSSLGAWADTLILCPFTKKRSLKTHGVS